MSKEQKLGQQPAFGFEYSTFNGTSPCQTRTYHHPMGMSKRFYAACAAMQGLSVNIGRNGYSMQYKDELIKDAYLLADELLKQENQ